MKNFLLITCFFVSLAMVADAVEALAVQGLDCDIVGGGGTGSYNFEGKSGIYNELQCGSYAFMDADYGCVRDKNGVRIDQGEWVNALFILTAVMSHAKPDMAICDAGLKAHSVDSGLPIIFGRNDVSYVKCILLCEKKGLNERSCRVSES